jgi:PAS domain S-box-containing protein
VEGFEQILQSLHEEDARVVLDSVALRCLFLNAAAADLSGLEAGALLPAPSHDPASPEHAGALWRELASSPSSAAAGGLRRVRHARTGEPLWMEVRAASVDSAGRTLLAVALRDVTARETALRELDLLRRVVDLSDDVLAIVDRAAMRTVWVNRVGGEWVGLSREEYMRLELWAPVVGATREMYERDYDELIAMSPTPKVMTRERLRADGTRFMAEHVRAAVNVDGRWIIAISVRDISARQRAETAGARFRAAVEASGDGMMVIEPSEGIVMDANDVASTLLGVPRESLIGAKCESVLPQFGPQDFDSVRASGRVHVDVAAVRRPGDSDAYIERRRTAFESEGRWLVYDSYRDVTERERAAQELKVRIEELARSNGELEQFAYATSHDLSEPLRMVGSFTQLLARRYSDKLDDEGREFMAFVVEGTQRMKRLIDDLLKYARTARPDTLVEDVALDGVLDDALFNLSQVIEETGATIERQPLPRIVGQRAALVQLFQNLAGNALKFRSGKPPVIRIEAEEDAHSWRVTFADNGIGIAPEHCERIFVVFQRLHSRAEYEGTGIGLAICKKVVERHGGTIHAEATPGGGTTFRFSLLKSPRAAS